MIIARTRGVKPAKTSITRCTNRNKVSATDSDEMQRPCRLLPAEERHRRRPYCGEARRHRQSSPDDGRNEDEDHEQIRDALQQVVRPWIGDGGEREPQVFRDRVSNGRPPEVGGRWHEVPADVSAAKPSGR